MRLLLQHRKELQETEIEIRYPNMTERITRLIQHIRQYDYMLEGFKEDKVLYCAQWYIFLLCRQIIFIFTIWKKAVQKK